MGVTLPHLCQKSQIKTQFKARASKGEFLGGPVPYGYKRNPENVGYLLIDEEAEAVVREIFELKIQGLNDRDICRKLDAEGHMTPRQYHDLKMKGVEPADPPHWRADTVRSITLNEAYLGHVIHGKFKEKAFLGQRDSKAKVSDWVVYNNVNPEIVSQDTFDKAKKVRDQIYRGEIKRWNRK